MTSVSVGPPDLKSVDPTALAIAKFLRSNSLLKQREGILNEQRYQFFRGSFDSCTPLNQFWLY